MRLSLTDKFLWDLYGVLEKTGDVAVFFLNPHPGKWNRLSGIQNPIFEKYRHSKNRAKFSKLVYYAKKNNYIKIENLKGRAGVILTKKGLSKALKASFQVEGKQKRKDGKWVMLIFDIPTKHKKARILLRSILYNLGYKLFQKSVWITPYDVSEKTEKLLQLHSLDGYVKIFLIEEI
ncbi:MAG: hypothetical protein A2908_01385 [Candidatus Staskawiczbacteria bacterium RIFCSPLOWO2_01_FULL_38_12b]|uniref:Transcriptional repressor PaaX-like central Cas2-like domain-containing protein n=1 Tax=Candidatus Staskawiczbacteria bacterium RIFCSPLOWO2_01_FULL_38_12b TaxID=1802214 RepID=A0A1G2ICQ1_9BACT|nr:MAG: hypothetical protein A2908_01385 [Candidatus Staskawiczbacteria bacterium RIFCSPLOWO2_01_FULL_38_12b]